MNNNIGKIYKDLLGLIKEKGIPEIELRMLLCEINNIEDMSSFFLRQDEEILDQELFNKYLARLLSGEPIQYIINKAYFYKNVFYVDNNVLIPRMETEELVDFAIKTIKERYSKKVSIIDVGTGSGCIAISLEKNLNAHIFASDINEKSLGIARKNALNLKSNIDFFMSNLLEYPIKQKMMFDILISNPPYIINKNEIDKRTIEYEPHIALYPDIDVYEFYKKLLLQSKLVLKEDALIFLEIGYDMKDKLEEIVKEVYPNKNYQFIKDINNNYRIIFIG